MSPPIAAAGKIEREPILLFVISFPGNHTGFSQLRFGNIAPLS